MKSCRSALVWRRRAFIAAFALAIVSAGIGVRAELPQWLQSLEAANVLNGAFFRSVPMPAGPVLARRSPREAREKLTQLVTAAPSNAELYLMRARAAEEQLQFAAAEADWRAYARLSPDKPSGQLALADFYRRRLRPVEELQSLAAAARAPSAPSERFTPLTDQRSWRTFLRILDLIQAQGLSATVAMAHYRAWLARYPRERPVYARYFDFLLAQKQFLAAENLIAEYQRSFPDDAIYPVRLRAALAFRRGSPELALAVYEEAFRPPWPTELVQEYFSLLERTRRLRDFISRARSTSAANPDDLSAAARIFYYHQQQGNLPAAERALTNFRLQKEARKDSWKAEELLVVARLLEGIHSYNEAARHYYALYSLPGGDAASSETALAGIINLLLTAPETPIQFGSGDLSFYRDTATMDPYPGFLNGILSLVLNSSYPAERYATQERASVAYFHRARAAELLPLFDARFAQSSARPGLHSKILEAYATYGDNDGVIRAGRSFLAAFPNAPQRTRAALLVAEACARKNQVQEEFSIYDSLLKELAERAGGVPLGSATVVSDQSRQAPQESPAPTPPPAAAAAARSPDYALVLDRYISRLVVMKQVLRALELYRREIDRNPNDPGLYERLAAFLDQNRRGAEVEQVYRRAIQQFSDRSWHHKLARWYLRRRQVAEFERLTLEMVNVFSGTDLEKYFRDLIVTGSIDPVLYRQVNLYAHQRFPQNLVFVRNLLTAYSRRETLDPAAWEKLLRGYWYHDEDLRSRLFEYLTRTARLDAELQAVRALDASAAGANWPQLVISNPAAARFIAEAESWRSHFESAAPALNALAGEYPGETTVVSHAAAMHRSLGALDPRNISQAVYLEETLQLHDPRNHDTLTRLGEIHADRERFDRAAPYWNRIAEVEPGKPEGYLEASTVFWDYFRFDDALRLVRLGRRKLGNPALYAYEAGAIYENKRDLRRAVQEYVRGSLAVEERTSPARSRLLQLARRQAHRALIEEETTRLASNPSEAAVALRIAVLEAEERREDLERFLLRLVDSTGSHEMLMFVDRVSERHGLDKVRESSLDRRISITNDPVDRMRLRLALARFHEGLNDLDSARQVMESLYNEHPTILGVVRAAVDFFWRNRMPERAIDLLIRAASSSYPALKSQLAFEAARKSLEVRQYDRARELLAPLLQEDPFDSRYLAALADTYARSGNDRALRDFYAAKIQEIRDSTLGAEEKTTRIAALRRGLIPALTRLNDPAGALDQYAEIINRYPEDESLVQEAASYASRHKLQQRLVGYYTKAATDSPRDYRWPMVLARIQTHLENFPAAIAAYEQAGVIRPERVDLYSARASLEERLMRFDQAAASYTRIYELTYRNPQWMERIAEIRARQREADAAVQAIRKAFIEGRPERPAIFFEAARKLESWNLLEQARLLAERGVELAGQDLLLDSDNLRGAQVYASIMTRLRQHETALKRLQALAREAKDPEARQGFESVLRQMGDAVHRYFTPEERTGFATLLEKEKLSSPRDNLSHSLLLLVQSAGLADLEARWRFELLLARPASPESAFQLRRLVELQESRLKLEELGEQLEAYWRVFPEADGKDNLLDQAARSYQSAGNTAAELSVLSTRFQRAGLPNNLQERFFELLLAREPAQVIALAQAERTAALRNAAADFAVFRGTPEVALRAVTARGRGLPRVWTRAYTALVGLYHGMKTTEVNDAFVAALGTGTIGERIGNRVDRNERLAGDTWFYYGARYGEYLALTKRGNAEDYLPSSLEQTPGRAAAYFALGEYYKGTEEFARALADYANALELDPLRGEAHARMAEILLRLGRREEAIAHWKSALEAFMRVLDGPRVPESFWENVHGALENVGNARLLPSVRNEADRLLRTYVHRNGSYRVEPLLSGAFAAAPDPGDGVSWILDLARSAPNSLEFLAAIADAQWLPEPQRGSVLRRIVEIARDQAVLAKGEMRTYAQETVMSWTVRWIAYLLDHKEIQRAKETLEAIPEEIRAARSYDFTPLEIRLAANDNRLAELLERYQRQPEKTPPLQLLRTAAEILRAGGERAAAARLLEFVYLRELEQRNLSPANFLGLAELRLDSGDFVDALAHLRRMSLVSGEPFENLEAAAALLVRKGRRAEAVEFLSEWARAVPWAAAASLRLAEAQIEEPGRREPALNLLAGIAQDRTVPYELRAAAAAAWGRSKGGELSAASSELALLGRRSDTAAADQPYFYHLRLEASLREKDPSSRIRLLRGALEFEPESKKPRLLLFRAAIETENARLAIACMKPLLSTSSLRYHLERLENSSELQEIESSEYGYSASSFLPGSGFDRSEQTYVARELAGAFAKLNRLRVAELFLQAALHSELSEAERSEVSQKLIRVRSDLRKRMQNAQRRPVITENLEQDRPVRAQISLGYRQSPLLAASRGSSR